MPGVEKAYTIDRVVRLVITIVILAAVLLLLRYLSDVLLPFAAAVVLAYLINPLVTAFERKTGRRGLSVGITIAGLGIVGMTLVVLLVPLMAHQIGRFRESLIKLRADLAATTQSLEAAADESADETVEPASASAEGMTFGWTELEDGWAAFRRDADKVSRAERLRLLRERITGTYIGDMFEQAVTFTGTTEFKEMLVETARRVAIGGWTVLTFVLNLVLGITGLIIVLLYLVFLLLDYPHYARIWPTMLPPTYRESIVDFLEQFQEVMGRYFRGQALIALATGILFAVGFTIIGLPMAVPFGLFVGLLNMVPYLQAVALVPALALAGLRALEQGSSFLTSVLLTLAVFVVAQVVQDALIVPRVMGKATGLRPVAILLGIFIWGKLLGFLGLLLAIPLTCLGIAYYRRYVLHHAPDVARAAPV